MPEVYTAEKKPEVDHKANVREFVRDVIARVGETPRRAVYGAYVVSPGRRFMDEQADEEVVLLLRSHPITNIQWILGTLLLLVVPQVVLLVAGMGLMPAGLVFVARLAGYLIALGYAFENFLRWYYSVLIVTNERIVDIDFDGVLHRSIAYAALNHVEQPSLRSGGLIQSVFNFGTVDIATAATEQQVEIINVPNPDKVLRIIAELSEELEKRRERGE